MHANISETCEYCGKLVSSKGVSKIMSAWSIQKKAVPLNLHALYVRKVITKQIAVRNCEDKHKHFKIAMQL